MKINEHELRKIIREEYMRGVPEFMLRQASSDCVERIKQHINKYIQLRAQNPSHARELRMMANSILSDLEDEIYDLVESKLWQFMQQT
jgi:hypothetical protein